MKIAKGCLIALSALAAGVAFAASPHFITATDSINQVTGVLTCSWKEAGLGDNQNIDSCPSGQSLELAQVSYTSVFIIDITNGVQEQLSNQSTGCLLPDVKGAC